jgi:hypothetical protein
MRRPTGCDSTATGCNGVSSRAKTFADRDYLNTRQAVGGRVHARVMRLPSMQNHPLKTMS